MAIRKTLRQREWVILVRPYFMKSGNRVYYTGVPKVGNVSDMGNQGNDTAVSTSGVNEGMEKGSQLPIEQGGWTFWYKTTSMPKLKEKYKELLELAGSEYVRVVEVLPVDTLITPIS